MPRFGARKSDKRTTRLITSTIVGPVGSFSTRLLTTAPDIPDTAPNNAARSTMKESLFVHWRAATAGAMTIALISTTPTV